MSSIDAVKTAAEISATYRRYLQSLLSVREPTLDRALRQAITTTPLLDKGPYLEATPPYEIGATPKDLIESGILQPEFARLHSRTFPLDRPLYVHQEQAIRKVAEGRNVVVATGTGSGKTESFLLPIFDSILREHRESTLGPGVRALLLYPMNALANDQMKRLRLLLATTPQITFGRYTGETEDDPRAARDRFEDLNIGEPRLPNELLSRQEMRETPPNILLTNYAMLEYLLLRPQDVDLFPSGEASPWRFLVVDEAHVYDGTQGAEIAMLLRRLRDRVAPGRRLQCIATSATVGGDSSPEAVTTFASRLFGEPFEWVASDSACQDLVTATRAASATGPSWGPLNADQYTELGRADDQDAAVLAAALVFGSSAPDAATALLTEANLIRLRELLAHGPVSFSEAASEVFGDQPSGRSGLTAMVDLASSLRAADGTTALSARYHLFIRATEGAFSCFSESGPHVQLARHEQCPTCDSPVFEIGACRRCGAVHLVGRIELSDGARRLRPKRGVESPTWLVLDNEEEVDDEDEEAVEGSCRI